MLSRLPFGCTCVCIDFSAHGYCPLTPSPPPPPPPPTPTKKSPLRSGCNRVLYEAEDMASDEDDDFEITPVRSSATGLSPGDRRRKRGGGGEGVERAQNGPRASTRPGSAGCGLEWFECERVADLVFGLLKVCRGVYPPSPPLDCGWLLATSCPSFSVCFPCSSPIPG